MSRESRQAVRAVFLAAIMVISVFAAGIAFSGSAAAQTAAQADLIVDSDFDDPDQDTNFSSIQNAVDNATEGDVIVVRSGNYDESVTVDTKDLTLEGAGNSASGTILEASSSGSGNGITVNASNLTVRNLRITDYSNGIRLKNTHSNIVFENVDSVGNSNRGMTIPGSVDFDNLELDNVNFSGNSGDGIRASTASSIDGLTITDSSFNSNPGDDSSGIEIYQNEDSPGLLNDVVIKDTEFIDNGQKGIYTEKLSNATIENVTVDGVISDTNGFNTGIDINLKYDDYENITIRDTTVANVSEGNPGNPSASTAVAVKARGSSPDDTSYTSTPASLDDVTIENVIIEDSFNGLRIGEFGKDYSGGGGPTNVDITDSTFQNNSGYHVEDVTGNLSLNDILNNQANDFDRVVTIEDDGGNITGNNIFGAIQPAVDDASSGDIVSVSDGTYDESVEINTQNVTIAGTTDPNSGEAATIVGQPSSSEAVEVRADEVSLEQLEIRHPTGSANAETTDFAGAIGVSIQSGNSNVTVEDSLLTDIGTQNLDANPIAVYAQGNTDDITVDNNVISDLRGTFDDEDGDFTTAGKAGNPDEGAVQAILINSQQDLDGIDSPITGATVTDNEIRNLTDTRSTVAVRFNGEVSGVIAGNDIRNLDTEGDIPGTDDPGGFTQVISLAKGGNSPTGPENVSIVENNISNVETTTEANFAPPTGIIVGSSADASTIEVTRNNLVLDRNPVLRTSSAIGVFNQDDDILDARLNWWGSNRGPRASSSSGIAGAVGYDPFLTSPKENINADDVGDTQQFAQDIVVPADQEITAVGFPGPTDQTVGEAFSDFNGTIYEYNRENGSFESVTDGSREISSLDAFVVTQDNNETKRKDVQVVIEYANAAPEEEFPGSKTIEPGFNFIAPRGVGDAYGAFNSPSDRETIYGTYSQPEGDSAFLPVGSVVDPSFVESTFGPEQDDPVVNPYSGYLVFTEEERTITTYVQSGVTADEILNEQNLDRTAE